MALCPECEAVLDLELDDVEEGQLVSCPECGVDLEVVNTNPLEFDLAEEEDLEADDEETEDLDFEEEEEEDLDEDEDEDEDDYDE
jgi:alpha-aminoadipate carrier protein LysW